MSKFAYTTYQKTLVQLRSYLRGAHFQKQTFIDEMSLLDDMIIDQCPLITKFEKKIQQCVFIGVRYFLWDWVICELWSRELQLRVASCELRVASCELRVASCELRVASCELRVASCELRVASCELRVASCELRVASCQN